MCTYRYRLRFFVHAAGTIQHEGKSFDFELPNGFPVTLSCLDDKSITKGKEFVLSAGGFANEQEAQDHGRHLKRALLVTGPILRVGIDAGKDTASSRIGTPVKEMMFKEHGVNIIDNVHGLSVYSEECPVQTFSISAAGLIFPTTASEFANKIVSLIDLPRELSEKETLCLELYGASHFEKSDRARFITLVLAVEALLIPADRTKEAKQLVDSLLELTQKSNLSLQEKESIRGSLRWLYSNSISQSLKDLAGTFLVDKKYNGIPSIKFISQCYDARSKLVHNGKVNEKKISLGVLAAQLNVFIADLLKNKLSITNT